MLYTTSLFLLASIACKDIPDHCKSKQTTQVMSHYYRYFEYSRPDKISMERLYLDIEDRKQRVLQHILSNATKNIHILPAFVKARRNFTHFDDIVQPILDCIEYDQNPDFNIGISQLL